MIVPAWYGSRGTPGSHPPVGPYPAGGALRTTDLHPRTEKTIQMSETLTDTTKHGADEATSEDAIHGRHRGVTAADDTPEADPHGRHRMGAAEAS